MGYLVPIPGLVPRQARKNRWPSMTSPSDQWAWALKVPAPRQFQSAPYLISTWSPPNARELRTPSRTRCPCAAHHRVERRTHSEGRLGGGGVHRQDAVRPDDDGSPSSPTSYGWLTLKGVQDRSASLTVRAGAGACAASGAARRSTGRKPHTCLMYASRGQTPCLRGPLSEGSGFCRPAVRRETWQHSSSR